MSMNVDQVSSDKEENVQQKVTWSNVTTKGRTAVKKIHSAISNQNSEEMFKKEVIEALQPVFAEVYLLVKTNVPGYEEFLDQFPSLHDLKHPVWAKMFDEVAFNASITENSDLKKQLTDMEVRLKAMDRNMPNTQDFIKVKIMTLLCMKNFIKTYLSKFFRLWWKRLKRAPSGLMMNSSKFEEWQSMLQIV